MIEGHGDDLYRYHGKIKYNFSSNIINGVDHTRLKAFLSERLDSIFNYPEPAPFSIERLIASDSDVAPDNVMVTNGAVEAIYTIANSYRGARSAVLQPTFTEYADACVGALHTVMSFSSIDEIPADADLIWICNPNNPTGEVINASRLRDMIKTHPDKIFIIDQAYHRYTGVDLLTPEEAAAYHNLILIYSLTKDYSVPGLRLGYIVANHNLIEMLGKHRTPWSVNSLAIEAAHYLISHDSDYRFNPAILVDECRRIASALADLGIQSLPSETNFILCRLPEGNAAVLKEYLVENHGILIRDASNFKGLTDRHFRIAAQTPAENDLLINAIEKWMNS